MLRVSLKSCSASDAEVPKGKEARSVLKLDGFPNKRVNLFNSKLA